MFTILSSLVVAMALPLALISLTDFIDSRWALAIDRFLFLLLLLLLRLLGLGLREEDLGLGLPGSCHMSKLWFLYIGNDGGESHRWGGAGRGEVNKKNVSRGIGES